MSATISLFKGEAKKLNFEILENNQAVNVSGATTKFRVARRKGENFSIEKTCTLTTDGTDGKVYVELSSTNTDLSPGHYDYEVESVMIGDKPYIGVVGSFIVKYRVNLINTYLDMAELSRIENKLGSDCSGVSGTINRVLTLTELPDTLGFVSMGGQVLYENIDYTISGKEITFLNNVLDSFKILVMYFVLVSE